MDVSEQDGKDVIASYRGVSVVGLVPLEMSRHTFYLFFLFVDFARESEGSVVGGVSGARSLQLLSWIM